MKEFKDEEGRPWQLKVNVASIKRVRDLTGIDLLEAVEGETMQRLVQNPVDLCNVMFALVKPQADEKNVTDEKFGEGMAGEAIDRAVVAFLEELTDFFPEPRRSLLKKAVQKINQMMTIAAEAGHEYLNNPALEEKLRADIAGSLSFDSQESSE